MGDNEKIFFHAGDKVQFKHDIDYRPIMFVEKVLLPINFVSGDKELLGIKCIWFASDGSFQEHDFNTKDLVKV